MQFFADEDDVPILLNRLNEDPELVFLVQRDPLPLPARASDLPVAGLEHFHSGPSLASRWKAVKQVQDLADGDHRLWHFVGHSLSSEHEGLEQDDDPWAGWVQLAENGPRPFGRCTQTSVIHLNLWCRHRPYSDDELRSLPVRVSWWTEGREFLASSSISWCGNRYAMIGAPAHPATVRWWARFQRWMRANATPLRVQRQVTFFAFPSALRRLRSGIAYYAYNWDLGPVLLK